jgi:Xaa-Pro dipeptidase
MPAARPIGIKRMALDVSVPIADEGYKSCKRLHNHLASRDMAPLNGVGFPRFSDSEFDRRRLALRAVMADRGIDHVLVYGFERSGGGVAWITGWPVTREAVVIFSPERPDVLLVQHYNHVPTAKLLAPEADVRWGGADTVSSALDVLETYGGRGKRIGFIGMLGYRAHAMLEAYASSVVDINETYTQLRVIKSPEEVEWLREGARLTDLGIQGLSDRGRVGMSEHELLGIVESAYVREGGATHIHYIALTAMEAPDRCVPAQFPSERIAHRGDVLIAELSAAYWGYAGQALRTFTVDAEPTPLYRDLHDVALAAFDSIIAVIRPGTSVGAAVVAAQVIEEAGFTTNDDLLHGFGGGYLPPIIGSASRSIHPIPKMAFEAGMTVVVQPNVVTPDERAGVQTGELVLVTDDGVTQLHQSSRGLLRIGKT